MAQVFSFSNYYGLGFNLALVGRTVSTSACDRVMKRHMCAGGAGQAERHSQSVSYERNAKCSILAGHFAL